MLTLAENEPPRLNSPSKGRTVRKLCVQPVTRAQQIKDEDLSASAVRRRGGTWRRVCMTECSYMTTRLAWTGCSCVGSLRDSSAPLAPDVVFAGKVAMEVHTGTAKMEVTPGHTNTEDEINLEVRTLFQSSYIHQSPSRWQSSPHCDL